MYKYKKIKCIYIYKKKYTNFCENPYGKNNYS